MQRQQWKGLLAVVGVASVMYLMLTQLCKASCGDAQADGKRRRVKLVFMDEETSESTCMLTGGQKAHYNGGDNEAQDVLGAQCF